MALQRARSRGLDVCALFTMFSPENGTSRSHGLPAGILEQQAAALGLPLHKGFAGWSDYEAEFKRRIGELVADGIEVAVFGDIFLDGHREWVERVCAEIGCRAVEPLWDASTGDLAREVVERGIDARVCTVRSDVLEPDLLGAPVTLDLIDDLESHGIDPCGEHGEYHTVVLGNPAYDRVIVVEHARTRVDSDHAHWAIERWHTTSTGCN